MSKQPRTVQTVPHMEPRRPDGHKGDYGRVLIVGGSRGMVGAVALAANAAFRGGAGLVTFAVPETVQLAIAGLCPCATSIALVCDGDGELAQQAVQRMRAAADGADVVAIGPGMAIGGRQKDLVRAALDQEKPLVIDADGLNNLVGIDNWWSVCRCPLILTPHPGEFARLTGRSVAEIQAGRSGAAVSAVRAWSDGGDPSLPLVCVLKGAGTVVTDGERVFVNDTGNPGMACGGSGDILTGLAAALVGQGLSPFKAAVLAANRHGRAADLAADEIGQISMMASDLLDFLPEAMAESLG